jgi:4-amino-4-deoxy-L-arabinose transferase-like glycosyltransferase
MWSKHLAAGYYDHPPMVAVLIRLGTTIAGDTELGVRLVSVLLGFVASWAVWRSVIILLGDRWLAATATLYFNLTLIVAAGTIVVTPDVALLVASSFVLFFLSKLSKSERGLWWIVVGITVGIALLSKYTAFFFGISIIAILLLVPSFRRWLWTPWPYLGGIVALGFFIPVVIWNAQHHWVSFGKQFGRTIVDHWTLGYLGEYLIGQVGLATPPLFILGVMALLGFVAGKGPAREVRVIISAFILPIFVYFAWHSLHARVEGNWTAPVFPALAIAAAVAAQSIIWTPRWNRLAYHSSRLAAPIGLAMAFFVYLQALFGIVPLGAIDPTARNIGAGWPTLASAIDAKRVELGAKAILTTSYKTTAWLSFYLPSHSPIVQFNERIRWVQEPEPNPSFFQDPLLYVCATPCKDALFVRTRYETFGQVGSVVRTRNGIVIEQYDLYRAESPVGRPYQ